MSNQIIRKEIEFVPITTPTEDSGAKYEVVTEGIQTVDDFVNTFLNQYPSFIGRFMIKSTEDVGVDKTWVIAYGNGKIYGGTLDDVSLRKIKSMSAYGLITPPENCFKPYVDVTIYL